MNRQRAAMGHRAPAQVLLLVAAAVAGWCAVATTAAEVKVGPRGQVSVDGVPTVPLGVWCQPTYLFDYYRHLGLNCVVGADEEQLAGGTPDPFVAAETHGLGLMLPPNPRIVGKSSPVLWGYLNGAIDQRSALWLRDNYLRLTQTDPGRLVLTNIPIRPFLRDENAALFPAALRYTDGVISHVWPECLNPDRPDVRLAARFVDRVRHLCRNRPGGEVSVWVDINPHAWSLKKSEGGTSFPAPTRDELRFQIWSALIHGADGICFFPISFDPFVYSQIPAGNVKEIAWNCALIRKMAAVLTAEESPLKIEVETEPRHGVVDWTTRTSGGRHYLFLLNGVGQDQTVRIRPGRGADRWTLWDAIEENEHPVDGEYTEKLPGLALRIWEVRIGAAVRETERKGR